MSRDRSDLEKAAVAVQVEERYVPQPGDGLWPDLEQSHADQLTNFAEVSIQCKKQIDYLPLARRNITGVQVADLEQCK